MGRKIYVLKENGKKKVKILSEGVGVEFLTMRNGFQWSGFGVDTELLVMMREAIDEYFENAQPQ